MVPARPLLSLPSRSTSTSSRLVLHHDQPAPTSPCHGAQARGSRSFVGRLQHRERGPLPAPASNVCSTSSPAPEPPLEQFCSPLSSSPQARPRRRCPAPETNLSSGRACEQLLEPPRRPVSRRGAHPWPPLHVAAPDWPSPEVLVAGPGEPRRPRPRRRRGPALRNRTKVRPFPAWDSPVEASKSLRIDD
ncbi:serine/arginine repetitive matrix protein 1-like isoform X3 [Hordeum vulgare subsp. vulgare]|uniref:serine/arginine repetitive matrix protein 1-like isoform X3 n=1 Tax=Hordeum vulgare subsp. vulgare TaxID=112509 RepID=UPI00162E2701|nr:serine/arginine repetitive matrix protein 1-like isoform X3 [Hordeum vulgare subsp. vulgare]XP_044981575.1 serine/arginine repetitive matrix protein 1-like isoform X3 [Hordeum vulgare subsp. vulgare]